MSLADRLWHAEASLGREPDLDPAAFPDLLADPAGRLELAALQLTRGRWDAAGIRAVLDRYRPYGLGIDDWPAVIRIAYRNRVAEGTPGSWDDVAPLGIPSPVLDLSGEGECGRLGDTVLGRYLLEARLGRGAVAVVYRGRDGVTGRPVAVKLPATPSLARVVGPLFRSEADATRRVRHPRVPQVVDCHLDDPVPVLALDLVDGRTLARWQAGRVVDPSAAVRITCDLLEPLAAAHAAGVVHRDPSPANVLVDQAGRVWLTDWNASLDEATARDGDYAGTPGYASQEGLFGLAARTDPRADVWSAAAVLYQLLTGRPPVVAADREDAVVQSAHFDPSALPFPDAVPDGLRRVCRKALHPNPALRHPTADEFRSELTAGHPVERRIRWADVYELGLRSGQARRCWLLFNQFLRQAASAPDAAKTAAVQRGIAQLILGDQVLLELTELAAGVGLTVPVSARPVPDEWTAFVYRPRPVTPEDRARLDALAADRDRRLTAIEAATTAQFAGDAMRAVFRVGYVVACLPPAALRAELRESPDLAPMPTAVRDELVEMLDRASAEAASPVEATTLFARRVREWVLAHQAALDR